MVAGGTKATRPNERKGPPCQQNTHIFTACSIVLRKGSIVTWLGSHLVGSEIFHHILPVQEVEKKKKATSLACKNVTKLYANRSCSSLLFTNCDDL